MNNSRRVINKHNGYNFTSHNIACKAILIKGIVCDGFTTYEYDSETNTLIVYDGTVKEYYHPKILDDDYIFPFFEQIITNVK